MHTICIADKLPAKYPVLAAVFQQALEQAGLQLRILSPTRDIWCRDYMPIQNATGEWIQFAYRPDYLMKYERRRKTISDTERICKNLGIDPIRSDLVVDGGNVLLHQRKGILSDKVFRENPELTPAEIARQLRQLLQVEELIFVPEHPDDEIGHADGMVRWVHEDTVLVNDYSKEPEFRSAVETVLKRAGLKIIRLPYNPYNNSSYIDATGIYTNYLQLPHHILFPVFGMAEDETALKIMAEVFPALHVIPINCCELAKEGGMFNCVSWEYSCEVGSADKLLCK